MLEPQTIEPLEQALRGRLVRPGDPDFDEARAIYNGMFDRRPALIAKCANVADVIRTVKFGREHGLETAARSGGHNGAGLGVIDDGLVIDLSAMKGVRVDPDARTVRVEPGCTWGDVDHATHVFGLATVSGIIGDEAVAEHVRFGDVPTGQSTMHLYPVDGAVHGVPEGETPWGYRDATWSMVIAGVDGSPANRDRITNWARDYWTALHPHSAGGSYINFMMEEGSDRIRATYADNYERLRTVKARYDPDNFFHVNQNIEPAR